MRILSYNILLGGSPRIDQLTSMIRGSQADVIGLVEATNAEVVEELAKRLHMHSFITGRGKYPRDWQVALLSRFPIITTHIHSNPAIFARRHMLEATLEDTIGRPFTVFIAHFTASFYLGPQSNEMRRAEVREIIHSMQEQRESHKPHVVMGDFNSVAPHDTLHASDVLRHSLKVRVQAALHRKKYAMHRPYRPTLRSERLAIRLMYFLVGNPLGRAFIQATSPWYTSGGIGLLLQHGYVDSFRSLHPEQQGYTFPSENPSCRIDYIFASPEMAARLQGCEVVMQGEGIGGDQASDHLPIVATFDDE